MFLFRDLFSHIHDFPDHNLIRVRNLRWTHLRMYMLTYRCVCAYVAFFRILVEIIIYHVSYVYLNCDQFSLINPVHKNFQVFRSRNKITHGLLFDLLIMYLYCQMCSQFDLWSNKLFNDLLTKAIEIVSKTWN